MSKQIDPLRNTDRQKRPNIYHVIDIGCHFDKTHTNLNRSSSTLSLLSAVPVQEIVSF